MVLRIFLLSFITQLSYGLAQNNSIVGLWETHENNARLVLQLNNDMTGLFDQIPFVYEIDGNELRATYDYGTVYYLFQLKSDLLTLKEGNLEHSYVFKRKAAKAVEKTTVGSAANAFDFMLLGKWANDDQSVQFLANGYLVRSNGKKMMFETKAGRLKVFAGNTFSENAYQVSDSLLSLVLDGQIVHLKKQRHMDTQTEPNTIRTISPELIGKWCFIQNAYETRLSGECMSLSKDGQYLFQHEAHQNIHAFTETGEWWANSTSLYFLSQKGQTDTYKIAKKKHPSLGYLMLNVDGRNFISADKKDAW